MPIILARFADDRLKPADAHWHRACASATGMAPSFAGQAEVRAGQGWEVLVAKANPCDPAGFVDCPALQGEPSAEGCEVRGDCRVMQPPGFVLRVGAGPRLLQVVTDLSGGHSFYWCQAAGEVWLSNRIELLLMAPAISFREQGAYFAAHYGNEELDDVVTAYQDIHAVPTGARFECRNRACLVSRAGAR